MSSDFEHLGGCTDRLAGHLAKGDDQRCYRVGGLPVLSQDVGKVSRSRPGVEQDGHTRQHFSQHPRVIDERGAD